MEYALEVKNISKTYKDFSLKNVSFKLPKGCIMGFIGENGAGKSTTIKLILDLIKSESGEVSILGQSNKAGKKLREDIGVVMDECCFPETINAKEINQCLRKVYHSWEESTYREFIERFSLPWNRPIKEYSKGMKMKLAIAAALAHSAKILILDEATSGLDPIVREEILDVFMDFIQDEKHSVFISSHIISDLEKVCDYITFIHKGRILMSEAKDEILEQYAILKCTEEELQKRDKSLIKRVRKNSFSTEALVLKKGVQKEGAVLDRVSLEDIMLFYIKGDVY